MNILKIKILVILVVLMSGVAFAQVAPRAGSTSAAPATPVQIKAVETEVEKSEDERVDGGSTGGDIEIKEKEDRLDTDDDGDGIDDSEAQDDGHEDEIDILGVTSDDEEISDSFFDVFIDFEDEETKAATEAFIKIDDIKGESEKADSKDIIITGSKVTAEVRDGKVVVRGWDPEKKEVTINPEDIEKGEDFLDFVGAIVVSDENIESVAINPEKITLKYTQPAKLFWFIPINLTAQVEIANKNSPKVKFPWYAFFTKDNAKEVRKEIDVLSLSWGAIADKEETDLQNKARQFQTISNLLKARYDTTMSITRKTKA